MVHRCIVGLAAAFAALTFVACSDHSPSSPTSPGATPSNATPVGAAALNAQAVAGSYALMFFDASTGSQIGSTLPAGHELGLWAQVKDSSQNLAQKGSVTFQVCKRRGNATFPFGSSAECDGGTATWSHVSGMNVTGGTCPFALQNGNACVDFGFIQTPGSTVGFRYLYIGQGSGIANNPSPSLDVTWS